MSFLSRLIKRTRKKYVSRNITYINAQDYFGGNYKKLPYFSNSEIKLSFAEVKNCYIYGKDCQFISPERNKNIIFEESFCGEKEKIPYKDSFYEYSKRKDIEKEVLDEAVPLNFMWSANIAHWTYDNLPRVILLESQGYKGQYIVSKETHITEFLHLFGVESNRICYSDKDYFVKRVVLPNKYAFFAGKEHNPDLTCYLHDNIRGAVGVLDGDNYIYIKRTNKRKVINEEEVENLLQKYDIQVVVPEEFSSIKEQFRFMTNVNLTVAPHGANCAPIVAQRKGATFIELFSNTLISYHFCIPAQALSLNYIPLAGWLDNKIPFCKRDTKVNVSHDILVPILPFKIILENYMKKKSFKF